MHSTKVLGNAAGGVQSQPQHAHGAGGPEARGSAPEHGRIRSPRVNAPAWTIRRLRISVPAQVDPGRPAGVIGRAQTSARRTPPRRRINRFPRGPPRDGDCHRQVGWPPAPWPSSDGRDRAQRGSADAEARGQQGVFAVIAAITDDASGRSPARPPTVRPPISVVGADSSCPRRPPRAGSRRPGRRSPDRPRADLWARWSVRLSAA